MNLPRITDNAISEMLGERAAPPMPVELTAAVVSSVRAARAEGRASRRSGFNPVLLVAAALAVVGGAAILAIAGSKPTDTDRPTQRPAVVASPATPPAATTQVFAAQPSCRSLDDAAQRGGLGAGPEPVAGPRPATASNGPVLLLGGSGANPSTFDPFSRTPSLAPVAAWDLESFAVNAWTATRDGSVVAAEIGDGDCASEIWVMRTDGTSLRRPFREAGRNAFGASWSPDGSQLAFMTETGMVSPNGVRQQTAESSVVVWDAATGTSQDLGRPCEVCAVTWRMPVSQANGQATPVWAPDGTRLATTSVNYGCGDANDLPCQGIAVVSLDGTWSIVPIPDVERDTSYLVVRWLDGDSLLVKQLPGGAFRVDLATGAMTPFGTVPLGPYFVPINRTLSPDGSMIVRTEGPMFEVVQIESSTSASVGPYPNMVLDVAWSPDSRYLLVNAASDVSSEGRGIYLAPVDGSEPARLILEGGYGLMVWLQGVPDGR